MPFLNMTYFLVQFYIDFSSGTRIGTTAYFITTMRLGSHKASSFMFIVPFSAVLSASIFLGETIQISTIFGGIFSTAAVYLINK